MNPTPPEPAAHIKRLEEQIRAVPAETPFHRLGFCLTLAGETLPEHAEALARHPGVALFVRHLAAGVLTARAQQPRYALN